MAHFQCEQCSAIIVAQERPERCESCGASAEQAYPPGSVVDDAPAERVVDHLFDMTGLARTQPPDPAVEGSESIHSVATLVQDPKPTDSEASASPIKPVITLELDEKDLEVSAPPPIKPVSTLELDEGDLEVSEPPALPPRERQMVGRVAYPLPSGAESGAKQAFAPVQADEATASGLPPVPPRTQRPLPSQTQSLKGLRARHSRRQLQHVLLVVFGLALVTAVVMLVLRRPTEVREVASRPDAAPDASPPDLALPDLPRPDAPPDAPGLDAPRAPSHVAATPHPGHRIVRPPVSRADASAPDTRTASQLYADGLRLLVQGDINAAILGFNQALNRDPIHSLSYRGLGLAYEKQGRKAMAREAFSRYLRLRPDGPDAAAIRKRIEGL